MKFKIQTDILKAAVDTVSRATVVSAITPVLENILIDATMGRIVFSGNNLEMAIEYTITEKMTVEIEWKYTISAKFLTSYTSLVQGSDVSISLESGGTLVFRSKSGETKYKWVSAEKYPVIPAFHGQNTLKIERKHIRKAIDKTLFSTADGNVRPMLAGICLTNRDTDIVFASTDSFRLSEYTIKNVPSNSTPIQIIVPKKTAAEISKMVGDTDGTIDMSMHENQLLVTIWQIKLYSRLLSGKFPDYTSFFPAEYNTKGVVLRTELIQSIKQTNLVARENHFNTRIRFHLEGNIEISTWDTEVGASTISVPGSVEGQSEIVGLNAQYLLDVLSVVQDDYTSLEFKNPLSPIVIRSVGGDDAARFRHIIMPLKI